MTRDTVGEQVIAQRRRNSAATNAFISFTSEVGRPSVGVKDLIDVAGLPTTAGATSDGTKVAASDAEVIANLRASGGVVVGKTNLYEWAYGVSSANHTYGDVHNPHDYHRSAGGSSSGSAAAVAANLCDWAIGTDTAGSVRIPAALCGVVGFKPTHGVLSTVGVIPLSPSQDVVGVLARDVPAAVDAFEALLGSTPRPLIDPILDRAEPRFVVPAGWVNDLDAPTKEAWLGAADHLPSVDVGPRMELFDLAVTLQAFEAYETHAEALETNPALFHPDVQARINNGRGVTAKTAESAAARLRVLAASLDAKLARQDVLVLPTTACVAPRLVDPDPREPLTRFTRPFSGTGHPAVSIPLRVGSLPVGLQMVARRGDDAWLLHSAQIAEDRLSRDEPL